MPRLIVTEGAANGLERCHLFLFEINPDVSQKAAAIISHHFSLLKTEPEIGRPFDDTSNLRELIIPFGESGYVALYRFEKKSDSVYILSFRHQKKAGY